MVAIDKIESHVQQYYSMRPLVAVFVGGTSGIGEYTIRALAQLYAQSKLALRVYVVGRNKESGDAIISDCSRVCPSGQFHFVQIMDASLIKNVDRVSEEIIKLEREFNVDSPRIDLLFMTQGQVVFGGRKETEEGLDKTMALLYYSRIRFIENLMPLIESPGHIGHVVSVYGAGLEAKFFHDDISLRDPGHYSLANARSHVVHMKTLTFERLSREHPTVSFVHVFPGIIITPAFADRSLPWWFKATWGIIGPFVTLFNAIPSQVAGQRMLYLTTDHFPAKNEQLPGESRAVGSDGEVGTGAYAISEKSEPVKWKPNVVGMRSEAFAEQIWQHTHKALAEIGAGRKFTD